MDRPLIASIVLIVYLMMLVDPMDLWVDMVRDLDLAWAECMLVIMGWKMGFYDQD